MKNISTFIQVSTRSRQNKKTAALLSCNRKVLRLPDNVPAVHLQFTEYYFPDNPNISGTTQLIDVFGLHFRWASYLISLLPFNSSTDLFESLSLWLDQLLLIMIVIDKSTHLPSLQYPPQTCTPRWMASSSLSTHPVCCGSACSPGVCCRRWTRSKPFITYRTATKPMSI